MKKTSQVCQWDLVVILGSIVPIGKLIFTYFCSKMQVLCKSRLEYPVF